MLPTETVVMHAVAEVDEAEGVVLVGAVLRAARSLAVVTRRPMVVTPGLVPESPSMPPQARL